MKANHSCQPWIYLGLCGLWCMWHASTAWSVPPSTRPAPTAQTATTPSTQRTPQPHVLSLYSLREIPSTPPNTRLAAILKTQILRVCVRSDIPPFGYLSRLTLTGFDIELTRELAMTIGHVYGKNLHISWNLISAGARITSLTQKSCDLVVASFSYTVKRAAQVGFSDVYLKTNKVLIASQTIKRKPPILAMVRGTTQGKLSKFKAKARYFRSYTEVIYAMEAGQVDYALADRPVALYMIRSTSRAFYIARYLQQQERYAVGLHKSHKALRLSVNAALRSLAKSGRLAYLHRQWL